MGFLNPTWVTWVFLRSCLSPSPARQKHGKRTVTYSQKGPRYRRKALDISESSLLQEADLFDPAPILLMSAPNKRSPLLQYPRRRVRRTLSTPTNAREVGQDVQHGSLGLVLGLWISSKTRRCTFAGGKGGGRGRHRRKRSGGEMRRGSGWVRQHRGENSRGASGSTNPMVGETCACRCVDNQHVLMRVGMVSAKRHVA